MSDGWDEKTAFGHNAGGGTVQLHARNSGMFFLLATRESLAMVTRLARRMEHEGTWDQSAWNQEQFLPAYGAHKVTHAHAHTRHVRACAWHVHVHACSAASLRAAHGDAPCAVACAMACARYGMCMARHLHGMACARPGMCTARHVHRMLTWRAAVRARRWGCRPA